MPPKAFAHYWLKCIVVEHGSHYEEIVDIRIGRLELDVDAFFEEGIGDGEVEEYETEGVGE